MKKILWVCVALVGCGTEPCVNADVFVSGLCVNTDGFPLNKELVEGILSISEEVHAEFGVPVNLETLLGRRQVEVFVVLATDPMFDADDTEYGSGGYSGWCVGDTLYIKRLNARVFYEILSHEVQHIVAREIMYVSIEDNINHSTPLYWRRWAHQNDEDAFETVEYQINNRFAPLYKSIVGHY
jgi:hypothetical protein